MKLKFKGNVVIESREQLEEIGSLLKPSDMDWEYEKEKYGKVYETMRAGDLGTYYCRINHTSQTITVLEIL